MLYFKISVCLFSFLLFLSCYVNANSPTVPGCRGQIDFVFLVHGSRRISARNFGKIKETLTLLTDRLHVQTNEARMGIIVYSRNLVKKIPITSDSSALKNEIAKLRRSGKGANTARGIQAVEQMFTEQYKTQGVPKVAIVISSETSSDQGETIGNAFMAKNEGINMFAIGLTGVNDRMELDGIASSSDQVLTVDTFKDLLSSVERLTLLICPQRFVTTWTPPTTTVETTTTPPTTTTVPSRLTTMAPIAGPCDDCKMENGVGFNPHPEDCDKFTQCYFGENNTIQAVYRQCSFNTYWDQEVLTCRPAEKVFCHKEKCKLPGLLSYPYGSIKSNRAHWKCNLGKSVAMCCPEGYIYRPYQGCLEHDEPTDPCPPKNYHEGACDSRPVVGDLGKFEQYVVGHGWIEMPCAPGTHYNPADCECSFHTSYIPGHKECTPEVFIPFNSDAKDHSGNNIAVENINVQTDGSGYGYFNGSAKLVIPRFSNFETYSDFVVKMRYLDTPSDRLEALFSNGDDCCDHIPSVALVKSRRNVHYMAKCEDDSVSTFHLPSMPGNWNEVYYIHDGLKLEGRNNGIQNDKYSVGKLKKSMAALQIGHGRLFQNFRGYIDYVAIYLCRPSYL